MSELFTRFTEFLQHMFQGGVGNLSVLGNAVPIAGGIIRIIMAVLGILILVRCILSLFGEKNPKEKWGTLSMKNGVQFDLSHWENLIGRGGGSDVVLDFPAVSRSHATLLRDDKGNWRLHPLQTKNGTFLNGTQVTESVPVEVGDEISVGGLELYFYPIGENAEREQERLRSIPERLIDPKATLLYLTVFQLLAALQCVLEVEWSKALPIAICFGLLCGATWGLYALYLVFERTAFEVETLAFFLCTLSFAVVAAWKPGYLYRQAAAVFLGILFFLLLSLSLRDLKIAVHLRWPVAAVTCGLLGINLLFGQTMFGAKNWVSIGPISFQPSEFVKVAFIFACAATLDRLFAKRNLIFTTLYSGFCVGCLALMSDFGTALIFFVAFLVIAFLRSGDLGFLVMMGAVAAFGCVIILHFKPYIANRFAVWHHVWEFASSTGYQQTRTMSAIAGGGFFGQGGEAAWLKSLGAANTDLVFGVVGQELGLILALCAACAILILALFTVKSAGTSRSSFYTIAACAAAAMLVFQSSLNIFGAVDILPLTGVTLPFVSEGGSSMIACWGLLAFLKAADTRARASFTLRRLGPNPAWRGREYD